MQKNFRVVRSRVVTPGGTNTTSPGDGAIISCSGDGWVRLLLNTTAAGNGTVELYCQAGITYVSDMHVRGVDTTALNTPLATNVVVNIVDLSH